MKAEEIDVWLGGRGAGDFLTGCDIPVPADEPWPPGLEIFLRLPMSLLSASPVKIAFRLPDFD